MSFIGRDSEQDSLTQYKATDTFHVFNLNGNTVSATELTKTKVWRGLNTNANFPEPISVAQAANS